jgi:heptosyltransferase-2
MIGHNLKLAEPLKPVAIDGNLSLSITEKEKQDFRQYMQQEGIDFLRPVMLVGVTAKLEEKTWPEDRMTEVLRRFIEAFPGWQLIFNYAPGREAENARRIYGRLNSHPNIFLNIQARSPRQLAAMAANCTAYFGNEGGGRHIVHAMGKPSLVVCSPFASKTTWLPQDTDIMARGIDANEATIEVVWNELLAFCKQLAV